jgi:hypothetical protein
MNQTYYLIIEQGKISLFNLPDYPIKTGAPQK